MLFPSGGHYKESPAEGLQRRPLLKMYEKVMMGWRRLVMKGPAERSLLLTTRFGGSWGRLFPLIQRKGEGTPTLARVSHCFWEMPLSRLQNPVRASGITSSPMSSQNLTVSLVNILGVFAFLVPIKRFLDCRAIMAPYLTSAITLEHTLNEQSWNIQNSQNTRSVLSICLSSQNNISEFFSWRQD